MEVVKQWIVWDSGYELLVLTKSGDYFIHSFEYGSYRFISIEKEEAEDLIKKSLI